jgi:hypothetical protein
MLDTAASASGEPSKAPATDMDCSLARFDAAFAGGRPNRFTLCIAMTAKDSREDLRLVKSIA